MISGIVIRIIASGLAENLPGAIGLCLASNARAGEGRGDEAPEALFLLENGQMVRLDWRRFHADAAVVGFVDELCGLCSPNYLATIPPEALRDTFAPYFSREWPALPRSPARFLA